MSLQKLKDETLSCLVRLNEQEAMLTGEKNLLLQKDELIKKVKSINPNYIEVIETESNIFERQGLFTRYCNESRQIVFEIPDWDMFISAVDAFYTVCYAPESEEEEEE